MIREDDDMLKKYLRKERKYFKLYYSQSLGHNELAGIPIRSKFYNEINRIVKAIMWISRHQ